MARPYLSGCTKIVFANLTQINKLNASRVILDLR